MNKKRKVITIIVVIIAILLLLAGAFLIKGKEQKTKTKLPVSEEQGEFVVITEQETAEENGDLENFEDETTNKNQATDAGKKGGSETLEIISPEKEVESNEDTENAEVIWLPGVW